MTIKERTQDELKSLTKTELRAIKTEIYKEIKGKLMPKGVMPILNAVKKELNIRIPGRDTLLQYLFYPYFNTYSTLTSIRILPLLLQYLF